MNIFQKVNARHKIICVLVLISVAFSSAIASLASKWWTSEEYGHGLLMPFIAGYIIWQRWDEIFSQELKSNLLGIFVIHRPTARAGISIGPAFTHGLRIRDMNIQRR